MFAKEKYLPATNAGLVLSTILLFGLAANSTTVAETVNVYGTAGANGTSTAPNGGPGGNAAVVTSGSSDSSNTAGAYGGDGGAAAEVNGVYGLGGSGGTASANVSNGTYASTPGTVNSTATADGGATLIGMPTGNPGSASSSATATNGAGAAAATAVASGGSAFLGSEGGSVSGGYASSYSSASAYAGGSATASSSAYGGNGAAGWWERAPSGGYYNSDLYSGTGGTAKAGAVAIARLGAAATATAYARGGGSTPVGPYNTPGFGGGATLGRVWGQSGPQGQGTGTISVTGTAVAGAATSLQLQGRAASGWIPPGGLNGQDEILGNAVGGSTAGSLSLTQKATAGDGSSVLFASYGGAGYGGYTGLSAGSGGYARSVLSPTSAYASSITVTTTATAGGGGKILAYGSPGTPGNGGAATAETTATDTAGSVSNPTGSVTAVANATAGTAGYSPSQLGVGGNALATATASSSWSSASSAATANGGSGGYRSLGVGGNATATAQATGAIAATAVATANGGQGGFNPSGGYYAASGGGAGSASARAEAEATGDLGVGLTVSAAMQAGGGSNITGQVVALAEARATVNSATPSAPSITTQQAAIYGTTSPSASVVSAATSGTTNVQSAFGPPAKVLGMFTFGGGSPSVGTVISSPVDTMQWTINGSEVGPNEDLLFGLFGPASSGSGEVTFRVTENGTSKISESFSSFSAATVWFTDNVDNLGSVTGGQAFTLNVSMGVSPSVTGGWFGANGIFGLADPSGNSSMSLMAAFRTSSVPDASPFWLLLGGLPLILRKRGKPAEETPRTPRFMSTTS